MLTDKAMDNVQNPLGVDEAFKLSKHVIVPDELATGRGGGAWIAPHLTLEGECDVIGVAEEEGGGVRGGGGGGGGGRGEEEEEGEG